VGDRPVSLGGRAFQGRLVFLGRWDGVFGWSGEGCPESLPGLGDGDSPAPGGVDA